MNNQSIGEGEIINKIGDVLNVIRGQVIELREAMAKNETFLTERESKLKELQTENEKLKKEIYNGGPSPEFKALLEQEQAAIRAQVSQTRTTIDQLADLNQKFEDQLLALVDLDKSITETLVGLK